MTKKDKRPTKIYPDHREIPTVTEPEEKPGEDVIPSEPTQPPII